MSVKRALKTTWGRRLILGPRTSLIAAARTQTRDGFPRTPASGRSLVPARNGALGDDRRRQRLPAAPTRTLGGSIVGAPLRLAGVPAAAVLLDRRSLLGGLWDAVAVLDLDLKR